MTTAQSLAERQNLIDLLKANYEILGGIVRRWAVWERADKTGELLRRPESSSTAVELAGDAIPYLRRRLGLAPDPNLSSILEAVRKP